ncbi:DUF4236 domain-containing protein [Christiangramia sp. LLG6405-1]|uniref:DUF4236 domain-containing protein n=1 Tax=Christiangramia sp. LLG6405-1 TaxID=3160832 RepID=UPI00386E15C7
MAWRYRKKIKLIPGVHLNLSKSGINTSIGVRGASITLGKNGTYLNTSIPGTGIYQRQKLSGSTKNNPGKNGFARSSLVNDETEIVSADVNEITSRDMMEIKEAIIMAGNQRAELKKDLAKVRSKLNLTRLHLVISYIFLYGLIFKIANKIREDIAAQKLAILQLRQEIGHCYVNLDIDFDEEFQNSYNQLRKQFSSLCNSYKIWDVTSEQYQDRIATRSSAKNLVHKKEIRFYISSLEFIKCKFDALVFKNANGADLYLYPNFVVMYTSPLKFAIIGIDELEFHYRHVRFTETGTVPKDSQIIDYTWTKVNKNGSRDKRFKANYQIPVVKYGEIRLKSYTGLNEEYQFSNYELSNDFGDAFLQFQEMIKNSTA